LEEKSDLATIHNRFQRSQTQTEGEKRDFVPPFSERVQRRGGKMGIPQNDHSLSAKHPKIELKKKKPDEGDIPESESLYPIQTIVRYRSKAAFLGRKSH